MLRSCLVYIIIWKEQVTQISKLPYSSNLVRKISSHSRCKQLPSTLTILKLGGSVQFLIMEVDPSCFGFVFQKWHWEHSRGRQKN